MPQDIVVEGLVKAFGDFTAVNGISFSVEKGEVFGILGPNGAGKTTALECIEGLQAATSGTATVLGIDTVQSPKEVKSRIGVQLQASAYFENLTLVEILDLFGRFYPRSIAPIELLAKVDLEDRPNITVGKLSGGQKQRFAIAAALVNDPEVVFLDEPTTGLDPQARRNLWEFVQSIHGEGRTVVLTTHYMEEAQFLCHRVAIMDHGKIVALDTPTNLIRALPVPYQIKILVENERGAEKLETLPSVTEVAIESGGSIILRSTNAAQTLPSLMDWASVNDTRIDHLEVLPATLEDVFLSITGRELRD